MRDNLWSAVVRLAVFVMVCVLATAALFAVFAQLRFGEERTYDAEFTSVTGLEKGNFVRIAGVEVGKVNNIAIKETNSGPIARVTFSADESVILTEGTKAVIRYENLIGGRYLSLEEGAGGVRKLAQGATIPLDKTAPALDLDALIGGFRPLFRALDPEQVNALSSQLITTLQGQGPTINSFLDPTAALTNTLADRDELIGAVIVNLNTVLGSLGDHSQQFGKAIESLSQLVQGLEARKTDISNSVAHTNNAAATIADLLATARPPAQKVIHEADRTAALVLADHEYFDDLLNTLPDAYQSLGRLGLYGDFFSFYLCEIFLKVNGKGGQPVFIKMAGQTSGRCTPK
jgi:phospholipid/cholesterol/gamma-HCH transport system substrate-binding protein